MYCANRPLALTDSEGLQAGRQAYGPPVRIIDVFIVLKKVVIQTDPRTHRDIQVPERLAAGSLPDWKGLQETAARANIQLNVYTEDDGSANGRNLQKSLQKGNRTVIFIGHSWSDAKRVGNEIVTGNGIRTGDGDAIGTFGVTTLKIDSNGNRSGEYTEIPQINATTFMTFSCFPGTDFDDILESKLAPNSTAYYNDGGTDHLTWIPAIELAGFAAAASMVAEDSPAKAVENANNVLKHQPGSMADGDQLRKVTPKRR